MTRVDQLRDLETAKQVASLLEAENARLHQRLEALVAENARLKGEDAQARLQLELERLKEQLALLQKRLFGASSEKRGEKPAKPPRTKPQRGHGTTAQPELKVQKSCCLWTRRTESAACAVVACRRGRGRRRTATKSPSSREASCSVASAARSTAATRAARR
ncbi:hypothetical protein ASNO1_16750 [Corallococcus caeni]|uniref:Transposase TnpC homeodomain domain-containing protein n=1 Tax=Corallococcus caeni TaxID=3082388 RepID=A0ABQ6QNL7_9BACT|nr:hypothetical protein ASNO1_16750 [Corallococcus sp. NO1]